MNEPSIKRNLWPLLVIGGFSLVLGQLIITGDTWVNISPATSPLLNSLRCAIPIACVYRFPNFFLPGTLLLLFGGILIALYANAALSRVLHPIGGNAEKAANSAWSGSPAFLLLAGIVVFLGGAFVLISRLPPSQAAPSAIGWLGVILGGALLLAALDRARGRRFLSAREVALTLGYVAWIIALGFGYSGDMVLRVGTLVFALAVLAALAKTKIIDLEHAGLVALISMALSVYSYNLSSWKYSFIGDEYASFLFARHLIEDANRQMPLVMSGVYGAHPVLASYNQALTMLIYGIGQYGWRISEILAVMLAAPALYVFARRMGGVRFAFVAASTFLLSHHMWAISRAGYTHSQGLSPWILSLALIGIAADRGSTLGKYLAGVAAAFGVYTFALSIPFAFLPGFFLLLMTINQLWAAKKSALPLRETIALILPGLLAFGIAFVITAFPSLFDKAWFDTAISHSIQQSEVKTTNPFVEQILPNFLYAFTAFLAFMVNGHYTTGAHFDPISSSLTMAGFVGVAAMAFKKSYAVWLIVSYVFACIFVGALVPYPYPSNTRTFMLLPLCALFAAVGFEIIASRIRALDNAKVSVFVVAGVVAAILGLNLRVFFVVSESKLSGTPFTQIVRSFQRFPSGTPHFLVSPTSSNDPNLSMLLTTYGYNSYLGLLNQNNANEELSRVMKINPSLVVLVPASTPNLNQWDTAIKATGDVVVSRLSSATQIFFTEYAIGIKPAENNTSPVIAPVPISTPTRQPQAERPTSIQPTAANTAPAPTGKWQVLQPMGLAADGQGNIFVVSKGQNEIVVLNPDGEQKAKRGGAWQEVFDLAVSKSGDLYALDSRSPSKVVRINAAGEVVAQSGADIPFSIPRAIATDASNTVFVADPAASAIFLLSPDLTLIKKISAPDLLKQPSSVFATGQRIFVADEGQLIVMDYAGNLVSQRKLTPFSSIQSPHFAMSGDAIYMTDPELGKIFQLDSQGAQMGEALNAAPIAKPLGISIIGNTAYVSAFDGNAIVKIILP